MRTCNEPADYIDQPDVGVCAVFENPWVRRTSKVRNSEPDYAVSILPFVRIVYVLRIMRIARLRTTISAPAGIAGGAD